MARTVNLSGKDVQKSQNTGFAPLPAGKYNVSVFDLEESEYKSVNNKGKPMLRLQLRVSDGQKGANRRLFTNLGDFPYWGKKDGSGEDGSPNFLYFQFYKALGVAFPGKDDDETEVSLPDLDEIEGATLAVKVKIVNDDYAYKKAQEAWIEAKDAAEAKGKPFTEEQPEQGDFLRNEVAEFLPEIDADDLADEQGGGSDEFDL